MRRETTCLIVNPRAAGGRTGRSFDAFRARTAAALGDAEIRLTEGPRHAVALAAQAAADGFDRVVAVGGDGTALEVVNGLMHVPADVRPALGIVPAGTGGDFRRTFGWSRDPDEALQRIAAGKTRVIDAGRALLTPLIDDPVLYGRTPEAPPDWPHAGPAPAREAFFLNIGSCGLSGLAVRYVNESPKALPGRVAFFIATVRALFAWRQRRVLIDHGAGPVETTIRIVACANGRYFGGGMMVAPDADPGDGALDVITVGERGALQSVLDTRLIYSGKHLQLPEITAQRTGRAVLRPHPDETEPVLVELDGECWGCLPAVFDVVPAALRLIV